MIIEKYVEEAKEALIGKILEKGEKAPSRFGNTIKTEPTLVIVEKVEETCLPEGDIWVFSKGEKYLDRIEPQLDMAAEKLKSSPITRRVSLPIWKPEDHLYKITPAITEISVLPIGKELHATAFIRSLNIPFFFDYNYEIVNYTLEKLCDCTDFKKGTIGLLISIPHIYERDIEMLRKDYEHKEVYGVTKHGTHIIETDLAMAWHSALDAVYNEGIRKRTEYGELFSGQEESIALHRCFIEVKSLEELTIHDKAPFSKEYGIEYGLNYVLGAEFMDGPAKKKLVKEGETYTYASRARYCKLENDRVIDQLWISIEKLKEDKYRRDCYMGLSKPEDILIDDPPCLRGYQFFAIDKNTLGGLFYMRSNDAYGALHANMYGFALLTKYIAELTGFKEAKYYHLSNDLHIYQDSLDAVKEILYPEMPSFGKEMLKDN